MLGGVIFFSGGGHLCWGNLGYRDKYLFWEGEFQQGVELYWGGKGDLSLGVSMQISVQFFFWGEGGIFAYSSWGGGAVLHVRPGF